MYNIFWSFIIGLATWYGPGFQGNLTYSGEPYNMYKVSCASNYYRIGTVLHVTDLDNGKSVDCKVNDKGGFKYPIVVDLSYAAFEKLDNSDKGVLNVEIEIQSEEFSSW